MSDPRAELAALRRAIDQCDSEVQRALDARGRIVRAIAAVKRGCELDTLDPEREREILERVQREGASDGFGPAALARVYAVILAESRALLQRELG